MPPTSQDLEYFRMMYEEHAEQARQHETLRAEATALSITLIVGLLAFVSTVAGASLWMGLAICFASAFGMVINTKHYERNRMHTTVMREFRRQIEEGLSPEARRSLEIGRNKHRAEWPMTSRIRLNYLWSTTYGLTFLVGIIIIIMQPAPK